MKRIIIIIFSVVIIFGILIYFLIIRTEPVNEVYKSKYSLPKVLYITTGLQNGNGLVAEGVVIALQTFNKHGALVTLKSREVLLSPKKLKDYSIIILSTAINYHDIDRKYSLTFLSDTEIEILSKWVYDGGILIAGDNVGRNYMDATDRSSIFGKLTPENWDFGKCFGVSLEERNIMNFSVVGNINDTIKGTFIPLNKKEKWALIIDSVYSNDLEILGNWVNPSKEESPALTKNKYGNGLAFLLPSSYLLHPANVGGYWSAKDIELFYEYIIQEFYSQKLNVIKLNPWPNASKNALCVTFNAEGSKEDYQRIFSLLKEENIKSTFFVNGNISDEIKKLLKESNINLGSNAYSKMNYRNIGFPNSLHDILMNENFWDRKFKGFRFPYTYNSSWGMLCLDQLGYIFDSSIGADNLTLYYGSVFPYNIPVSTLNCFKSLILLEVSPTFHDDYHFYKKLLDDLEYTKEQQIKDSRLFEKYLDNYWMYSSKPYSGAMVFIGHPMYTGYSDITLNPLKSLIKKVKQDEGWIATIEELADYWLNLEQLTFRIEEKSNKVQINISTPNDEEIKGITLKFEKEPKNIRIKKGNYTLLERDDIWFLIFDAGDGQEIIFND